MGVIEGCGEQTPQKWHSRFARERLDLSVSIEEELVGPVLDALPYLEESDETTDSVHTIGGPALFPPRLSLQSRLLPAVCSADAAVDTFCDSPAAEPSTQNMSALQRFAQRLTASFVALNAADVSVLPLSGQEQEQPVHASQRVHASCSCESQTDRQVQVSRPPIERVNRGITGFVAAAAAPSVRRPPRLHKQRLVSHTTKVRLGIVPVAATGYMQRQRPSCALEEPLAQCRDHEDACDYEAGVTSTRLPTVGTARANESTTSTHLPIVGLLPQIAGTTSSHLPIVDVFKEPVEGTESGTFAGSGFIEVGQCDVIVKDAHITAASVVFAMLTANPGPVVVQYISLQPHIGFTLHLTAPAAMRAPFNYIILLGEACE